jgi:ABC-2 type transport system permease protein
MNAAPHAVADAAAEAAPAPARTRPFYWSVRRELWENRSIYLAPLGVATFAVAGLVIHAVTMPSHMPGMLAVDDADTGSASVTYRVAALLMLATTFVIAAFYCLEALAGERRDRGILFWKSLPVSDLTTVLAKAVVPLVILPLLAFASIVAMHVVMLLLSAIALAINGHGVGVLWGELRLFSMWTALVYSVVCMVLWHAPIYGFLLLVSGWARRTAVLWAVLPLLAFGVLEKLTFDSASVAALVEYRLLGWHVHAFDPRGPAGIPFHPSIPLTPGRILGTADLWIGLVLAAVFIAAAVRMRRHREPI